MKNNNEYLIELERKNENLIEQLKQEKNRNRSLKKELEISQEEVEKLFSDTDKLNSEKEQLEADWEQEKKSYLLRIQELEEEIIIEKNTVSIKDNLVDNYESWKKKLEEELKTEKLKAIKLESKKSY